MLRITENNIQFVHMSLKYTNTLLYYLIIIIIPRKLYDLRSNNLALTLFWIEKLMKLVSTNTR